MCGPSMRFCIAEKEYALLKKLAIINDLCTVGRCSLSIQLPVVSALQITACPLPTAVLSNHTAFPQVAGTDLCAELPARFAALEENDLHFDALLIGYLGDSTAAALLEAYIDREKSRNPSMKVILDPVMADHGKLYRGMTEAHVQALRSLCCKADLVTPNLTEAAFLADFDYEGLKETLDNCRAEAARGMVMHALLSEFRHLTKGAVVITGIETYEDASEEGEMDAVRLHDEKMDTAAAISNLLSETAGDLRFLNHPRTGNSRPGTGDLFSAILSSLFIKGEKLEDAVRRAADFTACCIRHSDEVQVPIVEGVQFEDLLGILR